MIRISALNDSSDDESQSISRNRLTTKEAQESAALALYNRALSLQRQGDEEGAKATFCQLLDTPLVRDAEPPEENEVLVEPGLVLKYSSYKNLGSMAAQAEDFTMAMKYYLEAVMVDASDVTVWYKVGSIALKLCHYPLARHAFEQGLECQPRHWPCIDKVITVLYALNNYEACLVYIARALERDPGYIKGISFMEKILDEQPSLRRSMAEIFSTCSETIFSAEVDQDEADEYINEALEMRAKKQSLCTRPERPVLKLTQPLLKFSWLKLGTCLISLYDHIASSKPPITFSCKVDLSEYTELSSAETPPKAKAIDPQTATAATTSSSTTATATTLSSSEEPSAEEKTAEQSKTANSTNDDKPSDQSSVKEAVVVAKESSDEQPLVEEPAGELAAAEQPTFAETTMGTSTTQPPATDSALATETSTAGEVETSGREAGVDQMDTSAEDAQTVEATKAMDHLMDSRGQRDSDAAKRGSKRKRFMVQTEKRRSARVRNTGPKPTEDDVKIRDLIVSILPMTLLQTPGEYVGTENSQEEPMDTTTGDGPEQQVTASIDRMEKPDGLKEDVPLTDQIATNEQEQVLAFIRARQNNSGIIELLNEFLIALAQQPPSTWPDGLTTVYTKAYSRLHKHIILPGYLCKDVPDERIRNMGKMILINAEIKVDKWISIRSRMSPSPRRSTGESLGPGFATTTFIEDVTYLEGLSQCQDILSEEWANFNIRVSWMKARLNILGHRIDEAVDFFERTNIYLEYLSKESGQEVSVQLAYLQHDNHITQDKVKEQLESLHRCKSQDEMQDLHDKGEYEKVIQMLIETFNTSGPNPPKVALDVERQERHSQLLLLVESLLRIKDYTKGLTWGEVCLNEALEKYLNAPNYSSRDEWANTMIQILNSTEKCVNADQDIIATLTPKCKVRLAQNLMALIEVTFDVPESASDMALSSMLPMILLYKCIYYEERRQRAEGVGEDSSSSSGLGCHHGSMSLLELLHEHLGRRSWCCNSDGSLLLFIVGELLTEMRAAEQTPAGIHPQQAELELMLEQCFYCLYGHPNRRKAKHLQDHSSSQISLTWDRAIHVFEHFKPKTMPEYDSYKTSTVSGELESLLRRIHILIPSDLKLPLTVDDLTSYIEGGAESPPTVTEIKLEEFPVVSELYYLLADYYFKNKEQGKAIKFYLQDLCVNPERFDSWAGMALARASRLEQKLSMSELKSEGSKNEGSIWKHAIASLRSFQRALDLESTNSKLWIEYGALGYQLHTHASRQLKQQSMYPLTEQGIEEATRNRTEMLTIAENCYRKAGEGQLDESGEFEADGSEEEWLHHYMLGKVAEKKGVPLDESLTHYRLALHHLHEDRARYPRRINYIYSPPHLAVETLEVFYRLHVSIIKYLMKNKEEAPFLLFDQYVRDAAEGPFATGREKEKKPKDRESGNMDDSSNSNTAYQLSSSVTVPTTVNTGGTSTSGVSSKKKCHSTRMDHTYSKQRSLEGWRSDAESSSEAGREDVEAKGAAPVSSILRAATTSDSADSVMSPISLPSTTASSTDPTGSSSLNAAKGGSAADTTVSATDTAMSFSMSGILRTESSPKVASSSSTEVTTTAAAGQPESGPTVASPDTTHTEDKDAPEGHEKASDVDPHEDMASPRPITPAAAAAATTTTTTATNCTSGDELFPGLVASEEQRESQSRENDSLPPEESDMPPDIASATEGATEGDITGHDGEPPQLEPQDGAKLISDTPLPNQSVVKIEVDEEVVAGDKKEESSAANLITDSSSQDSATAAELEKLKSEISFLNSGSTDLATDTFMASLNQESQESEKEESDVKVPPLPFIEIKEEPEEDVKEETEESEPKNDALEALKSELQELSAAAAGCGSMPGFGANELEVEGSPRLESATLSQGFSFGSTGTAADPFVEEDMDINLGGSREKSDSTPSDDMKGSDTKDKDEVENPVDTHDKDLKCAEEEKLESEVNTSVVSGTSGSPKEAGQLQPDQPDSSAQPPSDKEKSTVKDTEGDNDEGPPNVPSADNPLEAKGKSDSQTGEKTIPRPESVCQAPSDSCKEEPLKEAVDQESNASVQNVPESTDKKDGGDLLKQTDASKENNEEDKKDEGDLLKRTDSSKDSKEETQTEKEESKMEVDSGKTDPKEKQSQVILDEHGRPLSPKEMFIKIMKDCMKALELCLNRFPHHYKSLYRLAYIYYHCEEFKNVEFARDLLLGNQNWQQMTHMPSPGLFQDRKSSNFFQGLWRIPIEEIDRSGSFACHMLRSLELLFPILKDLQDSKTLFRIHAMLSRTPDQGKKYLRDSDRLELARLALVYSIDILDELVPTKAELPERGSRVQFLLEVYRVWQHGVKMHQHSHALNKLLRRAFFTCLKEQVEEEPSVLEQAIRFCQQEQQSAVKSPTTPDTTSRSGLPTTPTAAKSGPFGSYGLSPKPYTTETESHKAYSESVSSKSHSVKTTSPFPTKVDGKVIKPCSVRLTPPLWAKIDGQKRSDFQSHKQQKHGASTTSTASSMNYKPKPQCGPKKTSASSLLKKGEQKKTDGGVMSTPATSASHASGLKGTKKMTPPPTPFSMFQGTPPSASAMAAGLSASHAALYAQLSQMPPEAVMAMSQEAVLSQMALATSFGIPLAALPYMFAGPTLDPSLWSNLAAAHAFQESQSGRKSSSASKGISSNPATMTTSSASSAASSSSQSKSSTGKLPRPPASTSAQEPPKKVTKMGIGSWSQESKSAGVGSKEDQPLSLTKDDRPLPLTSKAATAATVSTEGKPKMAAQKPQGKSKSPAGLKLSTKTSQLYAERMSSALARMTQSKTTPSSAAAALASPLQQVPGPPPPKVPKMSGPSSTSAAALNLSQLDMLATAAQTHRERTVVGKTAAAVWSNPVSTTTTTVRAQTTTTTTATTRLPPGSAVRPALKDGGPRAPATGSLSQSLAAPRTTHPTLSKAINLSSVQQRGASQMGSQQVRPKAATHSSMLARHLMATDSSRQMEAAAAAAAAAAAVRQTAPPAAVRQTAPPLRQAAPPRHAVPVRQAGNSRQVAAARQPGSALRQPAPVVRHSGQIRHPAGGRQVGAPPRQASPQVNTSPRQEATIKQAAAAAGTWARPSAVAPAPPTFSSSSPGEAASSKPPQISPGGYGRGKPSYPATLAARQSEDSSDDCIVISSGQESESD